MITREAPLNHDRLEPVWRALDAKVEAGLIPGYVAGVRIDGDTAVQTGGRTAIEADSPPMTEGTQFRIASISKPIGGALTLSLVQDGVFHLDDPVDRWLPEAATPQVLERLDGPLHRTTAAERAITVRDLLALTSGWGAILEECPLGSAMDDHGIAPGPLAPDMSADEFVRRVTDLPLACQPGAGWLYHTGIDLLGVLLARATGTRLSDLLHEKVTRPLGLNSTGFWTTDPSRLATAYRPTPDGLRVLDPPDGRFARPPRFEALGSGLVSTVPDLLRFFSAMVDGGDPVLTADSLRLLTTDSLTDVQRAAAQPILGDGASWGLGVGVDLEAAAPWMAPGRWGWSGGTGTTAYVDPTRRTVAILLTQREMISPQDGPQEFWTGVAAAASG